MKRMIDCTYWINNKCTACKALEDKKECDKKVCMHYHPLYKGEDIPFVLSEIYNSFKDSKDEDLNAFKFLAGHNCQEFFDHDYWEWPVYEYMLMYRGSKYARIGKSEKRPMDSESFISSYELMRHFGFKITKKMKRKYNRLKKKVKNTNYRKYNFSYSNEGGIFN